MAVNPYDHLHICLGYVYVFDNQSTLKGTSAWFLTIFKLVLAGFPVVRLNLGFKVHVLVI
jgi:hypothetical protein